MELAQVTNVVHDIDRAVKFHRHNTRPAGSLFQAASSAFFSAGGGAAHAVAPQTAAGSSGGPI